MGRIDDLCGRRFGRLTVMEQLPERQDRYVVYRCRCDCGCEVKVNSKRLKCGSIQGCPLCWQYRGKQALDLEGQRFGALTVIRLSDVRRGNRRTWVCRCDCGSLRDATTDALRSGNVTNCGCKNSQSYPYRDLTGQRIGMLTVIEKTDRRTDKRSILWRCRCDCGNEKLCSTDMLVHGRSKSCGCYRETELPKLLNANLHHVDGTCVEFLNRKKRADNTSGYTGVYVTQNGKYKAGITFKKKRYHLGVFDTMEEALKARKRGEEMHEDFLNWFYRVNPEQTGKGKGAMDSRSRKA